MKSSVTLLRLALFALAVGLLGGCAGPIKNMREAAIEKTASLKPEPGKALVVFMRPSGLGYAVQSSVFEVKDNQPVLVGIVAAKTKVAYQATPGNHLFMAIGESADYMQANLLPDRTYYVQVSPRMGMWKARFSLEPVKPAALDTAEFKSEFAECAWVEMTAQSESWAKENMPSVLAKHSEYFKEWQAKPADQKPALAPADGR
jgi:hypothetical protein